MKKLLNTKKNLLIYLQALALIVLICPKAQAMNAVIKDLSLKSGYSYLLSFDENIMQYRLGNKNAINIEFLTKIFNDKNEILLNPVTEAETNLFLWTQSNLYCFNITVNNTKKEHSEFIQDFSNINSEIINIDKPPAGNIKPLDFELDKPPGIK